MGAEQWVLNYGCNTNGAILGEYKWYGCYTMGAKQGVQLSLDAKQCVQHNGCKAMGANVIWVQINGC